MNFHGSLKARGGGSQECGESKNAETAFGLAVPRRGPDLLETVRGLFGGIGASAGGWWVTTAAVSPANGCPMECVKLHGGY